MRLSERNRKRERGSKLISNAAITAANVVHDGIYVHTYIYTEGENEKRSQSFRYALTSGSKTLVSSDT